MSIACDLIILFYYFIQSIFCLLNRSSAKIDRLCSDPARSPKDRSWDIDPGRSIGYVLIFIKFRTLLLFM